MSEVPANPSPTSVIGIHHTGVSEKIQKEITEYYSLFSKTDEGKKRKENYKLMTTNFYDLVTDFYEYGWGESFHFAARATKETFDMSIARSEMYVALRLGLKPGMKVIDCGCGVGGPLREIARFSGANIVGLNISEYQIERARIHDVRYGMTANCEYMKGDFTQIPASDESFDAAYAIEATCHSPSKEAVFSSIYRVLKPGAYFAAYEWCMTDKYDPTNEKHKSIKFGIELGNALPDIVTTDFCIQSLKDVGFEVIEVTDFGVPNEQFSIPWYDPLDGKMSLSGFRFTRIGRALTHRMVSVLETLHVAPKGSTETALMLNNTADQLVEGGKLGIFTPCFFFMVRKPLNPKKK